MAARSHFPHAGHGKTKYIELITRNCQACWKCVDTCPNRVLGKVDFFHHRHARVDHAEACKGCKECVLICPNEAIRYIYVPPTRARRTDQDDSSRPVATGTQS